MDNNTNFYFNSTITPIQTSKSDPSALDNKNITKLAIFVLITLLDLLVNIRVIFIVLTTPNNSNRVTSLLIAHLSVVIMFLNCVGGIYLFNKFGVKTLDNSVILCTGNSFLRNAFVSVLPVNVAIINLERMKMILPDYTGQQFPYLKVVLMWTFCFIGNIPTIYMVEISKYGECLQQLLFGSASRTGIYELVRLLVFNILPVLPVIEALRKIIKHLGRNVLTTTDIADLRLRHTVNNLRLVVLHGTLFISIWIPSVVLLFKYKLSSRLALVDTIEDNRRSEPPMYFKLFVSLGLLYFILNPIVHLHLNEDLRSTRWYSFVYRQATQHDETDQGSSVSQKEESDVV